MPYGWVAVSAQPESSSVGPEQVLGVVGVLLDDCDEGVLAADCAEGVLAGDCGEGLLDPLEPPDPPPLAPLARATLNVVIAGAA